MAQVFMKRSEKFVFLNKKFPELDWCDLMANSSKFSSNLLAKALLMLAKKFVPQLMHRCPYSNIEFYYPNRTLPVVFCAMVPNGVYRLIAGLKRKNGDIITMFSVVSEIS